MTSEFIRNLQELRTQAGAPSYRTLARRTGVPRATLHDALNGRRLPSLDVTLKIVAACDGDETSWRQRWVAIQNAATSAPEALAGKRSNAGLSAWWSRLIHTRRPLTLGIGAAVAVLTAVVVLLVTQSESASSQHDCTLWREYVVEQKGSILDRERRVIGEVQPGEKVRVQTLDPGPYQSRYDVTVPATGPTGYVNKANLRYIGTVCS